MSVSMSLVVKSWSQKAICETLKPTNSAAVASQPPPVNRKNDPELDVNPLMDNFANLVISPSGKHHYLGSSSSTILG
ncbi:hypothetical protein KCU89_g15565, partial [Aureobasidium melanogenum]